MISNVLSVIAAPAPVSEKHAPPVATTTPAPAPAAPRSFASLLQRSRAEATEPEPAAKQAAPADDTAEPAPADPAPAAAEAPAATPTRGRDAVKGATAKTGGSPWTEPTGADRTPDAKRPVLRRDEAESSGPATTAPWLPTTPAVRPPPGEATADERAGVDAARAPAAAPAPAAASAPPSNDLVATRHGDESLAAAAPADGTAPAFGLGAPPAATTPAATGLDVATVAAPVGTPDFAEALAVQVSVLVSAGVQRAELHLNPADMGPVSVQIVVDGSQARVDFGADLAATRQAIEASLPELASALRDAGMTLHGGGVSQHAGDRRPAEPPAGDASPGIRRSTEQWPQTSAVPTRRMAIAGGIDLYA